MEINLNPYAQSAKDYGMPVVIQICGLTAFEISIGLVNLPFYPVKTFCVFSQGNILCKFA